MPYENPTRRRAAHGTTTVHTSATLDSVDVHPLTSSKTSSVQQAASIFSDAFAGYPLIDWALGARGSWQQARYKLFLFLLEQFAFPSGAICETHSDEGAAVWMRIKKVATMNDEACAQLTLELKDTFGVRAATCLQAINQSMQRHHFNQPHVYLYLIGIRQRSRGLGIGTRLLESGLDRADEAQLPVFLETSSERAADFYRGFGFNVTEGYSVAPKSPETWTMLRMPQTPK